MRVNYGRSLRRYLLERCQPILLLDFAAEQIFEGATVDTNILQFGRSRGEPGEGFMCCSATSECRNSIAEFVLKFGFTSSFDGDDVWAVVSPVIKNVKRRIEQHGIPLCRTGVTINYGIKTGLNKVFIVDENIRDQLIADGGNAARILRPILFGRDIKRYHHRTHSWLIATHNGQRNIGLKRIDVSEYPSVKRYLDKHKGALKARSDQGDTVYNLRECAYWESFSRTKIVWAELARSGNAFSLDESGSYVETSGFTLTVPDDNHTQLKLLLAVLNSKVILFYLDLICSKLDATGWRWKKQYVELLPIPKLEGQVEIVALVDRVLAAKKKDPDADTSALEAEIDQLVYKLYGLTEEEIAIVERRGNAEEGESGAAGGATRTRRVRRAGPESRAVSAASDDDEELE